MSRTKNIEHNVLYEDESVIGNRASQLTHLLQTVRVLNSTLDLKEVLTRICSEAKVLLNSYGSTIYILDKNKKSLKPIVSIDPEFEEEILAAKIDIDNSFTGQAILQNKFYFCKKELEQVIPLNFP